MVIVAQLVRASDCGSEGRGFETRLSPFKLESPEISGLFLFIKGISKVQKSPEFLQGFFVFIANVSHVIISLTLQLNRNRHKLFYLLNQRRNFLNHI